MSNERLCSQGHVVDADRETCSRCNGPVVNQTTESTEIGSVEETKPMTDENTSASVEDTEAGKPTDSEGNEDTVTGDSQANEEAGSTTPAPEGEVSEAEGSVEGSEVEAEDPTEAEADLGVSDEGVAESAE